MTIAKPNGNGEIKYTNTAKVIISLAAVMWTVMVYFASIGYRAGTSVERINNVELKVGQLEERVDKDLTSYKVDQTNLADNQVKLQDAVYEIRSDVKVIKYALGIKDK